MNNTSFKKYILFVLTVFLFASCDKDFNEIGTNIIGNDNFEINKYSPSVVAYNQNLGPVQTNNLTTNALGIYNNDFFGETTANFAAQVVLKTVNPTIDLELKPVIDSVILYIPYFVDATKTILNADESSTYTLESTYGPTGSKIKLGVYESGYYMRDFDPGTQESQVYYSNQNSLFDNVKGPLLYNNDEFDFSNAEIIETVKTTETESTKTRITPGIRLKLDINYFKTKILEAPAGKLATNDIFKNYFRGLYFKVEKSDASATTNLALINFSKGTITIKYKEDTSTTDETRVPKSLELNLTGNSVNLFQNNYNQIYTNGIASPNSTDGDEKLYLKGGEGSMAVIDIFKENELEVLRANKWLINDASLTFTIDTDAMKDADEPNRIYIYDLNNNIQLIDYTFDTSLGATSKFNKSTYGGIIEKVDEKGTKYKIKLTNHIRNLVSNSTVTNVKLGLVVTENINDVSYKKLATSISVDGVDIKQTPTSSVINPLGTVLFGTNPNVPEEKRLKFEIYYTKPN